MSNPRIEKAIINRDGSKIILTYSENLSETTALSDDFEVNVNGSVVSISSLEVVGSSVALTLVSKVDHSVPVTISYSDPSLNNDINAIQDTQGNDAESFSDRKVRNLRGFTTYEDYEQMQFDYSLHEFKNLFSFAALKDDGSVVTWGSSSSGGDSSSVSS